MADLSRSSRSTDASDDLDAHGHIGAVKLPAGGRKVAGSNPVAPINECRAPRPRADHAGGPGHSEGPANAGLSL
jgi:hypothetical protein